VFGWRPQAATPHLWLATRILAHVWLVIQPRRPQLFEAQNMPNLRRPISPPQTVVAPQLGVATDGLEPNIP